MRTGMFNVKARNLPGKAEKACYLVAVRLVKG